VALAGLARDAPIAVTLETDQGPIRCALDPARTPRAVSLFVGLATGRARWRDPRTGAVVRRPLYAELAFHRAIAGVMIQSGCPLGEGTGHPGYRIEVEPRADDAELLTKPGALLLARYTAPPFRTDPNPPPPGQVLGSQFAITLTDMHHLAGQVSVLGTCQELGTARRIAELVAGHRGSVRLIRVRVSGVR
jgi:peptidyl-prolyl cis-trans isomerase A (cyclophilin A)